MTSISCIYIGLFTGEKKQYKKYLTDASIAVPRATLYRHYYLTAASRSETYDCDENSTNDRADGSTSYQFSDAETSQPTHTADLSHRPLTSTPSDDSHASTSDNCHISEAEDSHADVSGTESGMATLDFGDCRTSSSVNYGCQDTDTPFDNTCQCDDETVSSPSESFVEDHIGADSSDSDSVDSVESDCHGPASKMQKALTAEEENCMAVFSYVLKHHISGKASQELFDLLDLMSESESHSGSLLNMKKILACCQPTVVDICEKCHSLFPKDDSVLQCITKNCQGLRYKGNQQNKRKCYLAYLPIESQLKDLFQREGVWKALVEFRSETESCTSISDITTAEIIQELRQPGNFLHEKGNFSMLFNTDGVPLYRSSGVSIWPVYLVINELPPVMRFARKNMILWGIWQGRGKPIFSSFFEYFVREMIHVKENGVQLSVDGYDITCRGILLVGTLDLQAKAMVADMTMHNGQFGCITCKEPGQVVQRGKGYCRMYPYRDPDPEERNSEGIQLT